jgi:hypothetical protein
MTVPPSPSFPLTKPFGGACEESDELHSGASPDLERDPVGPLGTPTCQTEKAEELMAVPKQEESLRPLSFWLNHAALRAR